MLTRSKIRMVLTSILAVSSCAVVVAASAFAWFSFNKNLTNSIVTTAGNIDIGDYTALAYKYTYPYFGEETGSSSSSSATSSSGLNNMINYEGTGTVKTTDLKTYTLDMNEYDPFYLYLNPDKTVKDLMTNLCLHLTATFTANADTTFSVSLVRIPDASWTSSVIRVSNYLDYWITSTDLSAVTSVTYNSVTYTAANDCVFYSMKNYDEANTASSFRIVNGSTTTYSSSLTLFTHDYLIADATSFADPTSLVMQNTVSLYLGIDYNETSLASYSDSLVAGQSIYLGMDYYIVLQASQKVAA